MAFHFSRRRLKAKEDDETGELNIIPYLDILMNLIMFMLLSITGLATFGVLDVVAPSYGASGPGADPNKPDLILTVLISKKGFFVAGSGAVLGQNNNGQASTTGAPTVPMMADGTYDYSALTTQMTAIKKEFPKKEDIIIGAEADVNYDTLVQTMDAVRETAGTGRHGQLLFPIVTLAAM